MKTITKKVYLITELPDQEAFRKAVDAHRDVNTLGDWYEPIYEEWLPKLKQAGFVSPKIMFSGFSSQGDGACFTAEGIVLNTFLTEEEKKKYAKLLKRADEGVLTMKISHSGKYYHATSTSVNVYCSGPTNEIGTLADELEELIKTKREKLGNAIYKALESYHNDLTSEDAVCDELNNNECYFDENGNYEKSI